MKKLSVLTLVLAMLVLVFASCGEAEKEVDTLDAAIKYVQAMYKDGDGSVTQEDFKVVGVVNIEGTTYDVVWTTSDENVKVVPDEDGKMVTIDVDEQSPAAVGYTLTATIKDAEGKEVSCSFKHSVPEFKILTIPEVVALDDGAAVVLSGTVTAIDTEWSEQYGNISVYIEDADGNRILCYRLGTNVTVGDVLIVKGNVGSYNGAKQIAQGATAEITDHVEIVIDFPEMTLAEAAAAEDGTNVTISGVVIDIAEKDAWSDKYNNMSVTIADATGTLYLYRLGTKVEIGDAITLQGAVGSYNGAKQIAQGATAEILGHHAPVSLAEAIASEDGTLVAVLGVVGEIGDKDAWSDKYNNMSVTITDAEGNSLYVYRLGTKVEEGDAILVYGTVGSYKEAKQIAQGGFAIIQEAE